MGDTINFDYYYGIEAEQFSFYRVPRLLIKDERFKGLSSDAKLLYGLMLDRMSLSMMKTGRTLFIRWMPLWKIWDVQRQPALRL